MLLCGIRPPFRDRRRHVGRLADLPLVVESYGFKGLSRPCSADPELYRRVAEGLPDAWLEDPALTPVTDPVLAPHVSRITWDAAIRSVADITALATRSRMVNVKPSRFGALETLLDALDHLEAEGIGA